MKKMISILALSLLSALPAFAGTVRMDANDYASLPDCGGVIQTKISNGATQLNLVFSDVSQCSNFDIVGANGDSVNYPNKKLQGVDRARSGSFTIPSSLIESGKNTIIVKLQSNSKKTSDTIIITVRSTSSDSSGDAGTSSTLHMSSNDFESLESCGGTVKTSVSGEQLNIVFKNVSQCSNFDILRSNGDRVDYPNMKLGGDNGDRSGSFTLPKKVIDFGFNTVTVKLKSNSGKTSETIVIRFLSL